MLATSARYGRKSYRYLSKNVRYFVEDPSFLWMKTMARFEFARELAARRGGRLADGTLSVETRAFATSCSPSDVVETLRSEGYFVGLTLRPELASRLFARAREARCYADRDPALPFSIDEQRALEQKLGRNLRVASYFDQQERWPEFRAVLEDPWIEAISRAYLGCEPLYLRSELAWSYPRGATTRAERIAMAQSFHCDINDFRTLKFFFYLTDVGLGSGPHAYIKKNPQRRLWLHQLLGQRCASIPEAELVRIYGENEVVTVCGPAGTGFVGDPYYFHRGTAPTEDRRLLMQIEIGCRRYRTWYNLD